MECERDQTQSIVIPGMVVQACNPSSQEAETEVSWAQGQPWLNREIKDQLGYKVRPCLKTNKQ
jgi:hypothetical protein